MTWWLSSAHSLLEKVTSALLRFSTRAWLADKMHLIRYPAEPIVWHRFRRHDRDEEAADNQG